MFAKTMLLACLLQLVVHTVNQSVDSCIPDHFRYLKDEATGETSGRIEIRRAPKGIALKLSVSLSIAAALPSNYVGRVELAQSKQQSIQAVQQGRPLKYNLHFPLNHQIPVLTGLWFNNRLICTGPRAAGQIVTNIVLNHTLYPPGVVPLYIDNENVIPTRPKVDIVPTQPVPTEAVYVPITTIKPKVKPKPKTQECGRTYRTDINPLIVKGSKTNAGDWPWLAAIFITRNSFEYQCAGTLVTNTHVITAAHCFQLGNERLLPGVFLVSLGRYRLKNWREEGSVNEEVADYKLHPDYITKNEQQMAGNADSDLAVLFLRHKVEFTNRIYPICLWAGPTQLDNVVGKKGFVVGWGRDEIGNAYVEEPLLSKSSIVSQTDCIWSNPVALAPVTSNRTFCAGSRDGSGPCNGDSGSGFVMYDPETGRYQLRGVVSRSILDRSTMSCDLTQYVIYVDVAQHLDWILQQIFT